MLDPVKNFAKVIVSTGYDNIATSVILSAGHGAKLPDPSTDGAFNLVWWNATDYADPTDDPDKEIVRVTARITDTLTVTRAQESTVASVKNVAAKTYQMILAVTQKTMADLKARGISVQTITGTVNGVNSGFTVPLAFVGKSVISLAGQIFVEDVDYTVSGTAITFTTPPPADYAGQTFVLICVV